MTCMYDGRFSCARGPTSTCISTIALTALSILHTIMYCWDSHLLDGMRSHGSDSPESAAHELKMWFPEGVNDWGKTVDAHVYES